MRRGGPRLPDGRARDKAVIARVEQALLEKVDELAVRMSVSRSWVLRRALIEYIDRELSR